MYGIIKMFKFFLKKMHFSLDYRTLEEGKWDNQSVHFLFNKAPSRGATLKGVRMNRSVSLLAVTFVLSVCLSLSATAQINEGFDNFQIGARPAGWEFIYCDRNSDADMDFYGDTAPGIQLGGWPTLRARIVTEEYTLAGAPGDSDLSFYVQAIASNPSSALNIREYDGDAAAWADLTYLEGPFELGGETITLALNASSSQRVWIEYIKLGDVSDPIVVIDDVAITNVTVDPPPPPVVAPSPIYLVVASDDYIGDGESDVAIYEPDTGYWVIDNLGTFTFGGGEFDVPAPGDYNGDGVADLAYFDRSTGRWYAQSAPGQWIFDGELWGNAGDVPVPGDYSGDGTTDLAVWRPSTGYWYVRGVTAVRYGYEGIIPVPGDYTGDGATDIAYINTDDFATWRWFVDGVPGSRAWGLDGDIAVPGVYGGVGVTDLAAYRPGTGRWWYRRRDGSGTGVVVWGGQVGDVPVVGDFDGDGIVDAAVFQSPDQWVIRDLPDVTLEASPSAAIVVGAPGY